MIEDLQEVGEQNWFSCEPESEERMHGCYWRYTPCEVLRHIYLLTEKTNIDLDEIRLNLRIASTMTKSLAKRLVKYEGVSWGRKVYPYNPNWRLDKFGVIFPKSPKTLKRLLKLTENNG